MKKFLPLLIAVCSVALCSLFVFTSIDRKTADIFQRALPVLDEKDSIVMINVDDGSVEEIGSWPFSRDVYADALISLKELGTEAVVFDLSFLDKSPAKVDEDYVKNTLPNYVDTYFSSIEESAGYIIDEYASGSLKAADASQAKKMFSQASNDVKDSLNTSIAYVIHSQDEILGNAIKFFDNTYLTLTLNDEFLLEGDEHDWVASNIVLKDVEAENDTLTPEFVGIQPAIPELIHNAKTAGFVNADPDRDGYLRRVHLVYKYEGQYYGQLLFVPVLAHLGNPKIAVSNSHIILKGARMEDGTTKDIRIPRSEDGSVIVKYPPIEYEQYKNLPLWNIYRISILEKMLYDNLKIMSDNGFLSVWDGDNTPVDFYENAEFIKNEICKGEIDEASGVSYATYFNFRKSFFDSMDTLLSAEYENTVLGIADDDETVDFIKDSFKMVREQFGEFTAARKDVSEKVNKAICIVGTCATSTTDYGLIQYQEHYPNPGLHYAVANQILTEDFVDDAPAWISIVIASVLCLVSCFLANKIKSTTRQLLTGGLFLIATTGAILAYFIVTKVYIGLTIPFASLFISFVATTIIGFLTASHEKKFITNAFSQCLSKDVVADIVNNPSSLKLGGDSREMTAIFTDIQKFSGFSELLNAAELVALLNYYLTPMSDKIMDEGGMVDKYEGDAIVALVGAPLKLADHASRACRAAITMKKFESEMNAQIVKYAAMESAPDISEELHSAFKKMVAGKRNIFTRIGINSGEMVAGFMGSDNKKNYTMMGNNVNLASRLEGVNKQYSTDGILISEATRNLIGDEFIVRSLDRVQVVNVKTPMRLFELMETKADADEKLVKYVACWETSMKTFESGDYAKALEMFQKCAKARPSDNVAKYYVSLVEKFFINGKYPTKDDDFGVAYNAENPEDMDPSWIGTKFEIKGTFTLLQK
ncbi:CHASE2 domain-containing protein [Treponema sp.]|uniref:CHASE2 domain-containing protein n=1 Tax=Treponema sp. TaxID=166 RepID=UPI0038906C2A